MLSCMGTGGVHIWSCLGTGGVHMFNAARGWACTVPAAHVPLLVPRMAVLKEGWRRRMLEDAFFSP